MAPTNTMPKVYIHLIRHAQAQSNYQAIRRTAAQQGHPAPELTQADIDLCRSIQDPRLTPHGIQEALALRTNFPFMNKITHIITSPLRRTLQTTLLGLEPAIRRGIQPIALDILRETGMGANSCGSYLPSLLDKLANLGGERVVTTEIERGWEVPTCSIGVNLRAKLVKYRIKDLARVARMQEFEREEARLELDGGTGALFGHENRWLMEYDVPFVEEERDVHIAVVSHGSFLKRVIGDGSKQMGNAEYRTFEFEAKSEGGVGGYNLVETDESYERWFTALCEKEAAEKRIEEKEASEADAARSRLVGIAQQALVLVERMELDGVDAVEIDVA
ncbi:hypothetical protein ONS96_004501 [Cadophora gregata f. sp. sojae]|nr:hypothetical protein ONS96_004501 [Cadophora gregata f. sp. sojae]